ncbi:hypothetical protein D9M68_684680 [compost metagenome]
MDAPSDLAECGIGATLRFQRAGGAVSLAGAVDDGVGLGHPRSLLGEGAPCTAQRFAGWAAVFIGLLIPVEVITGEAVVLAFGLVPHRHMRLDALLFDHPGQHRRSAIGGVADEAFRCEIELRFDTLDHRPGRIDFGGTVRRSRFYIHDHAVLGVDQVVGGVGKVSRAAWRCCPTRQRIGE